MIDSLCVGCPDIHCDVCEKVDTSKCTKCIDSYFLLNQTCIICNTNCITCDAPNHCT